MAVNLCYEQWHHIANSFWAASCSPPHAHTFTSLLGCSCVWKNARLICIRASHGHMLKALVPGGGSEPCAYLFPTMCHGAVHRSAWQATTLPCTRFGGSSGGHHHHAQAL